MQAVTELRGDKTERGACSAQHSRGRGTRKGPGWVREEVLTVLRNIRLQRDEAKVKIPRRPRDPGFCVCLVTTTVLEC